MQYVSSRYGLWWAVCSIVAVNVSTGAARADGQAEQFRAPAGLTKYDFATRDDLLYGRMLESLIPGDRPSEWPLLDDVAGQVGAWVNDYLEAGRIAQTITSGMPIAGTAPLRDIDRLVTECAEILDVPKPSVFVRNSPITNAYITEVNGRGMLILTSGLLRLYAGRPAELRFVVGHELGHMKCGHVRLKTASYGILSVVQGINVAVVPDRFQLVLPTLALGRLFSWARESEISADRAGLICCQDPDVAFQALLRLLHGLEADNSWIDPQSQDFDAESVVKEYRRWQHEPFVRFILHLQQSTVQSPFIPERVAALKLWSESEAFERLMKRRVPIAKGQLVVIEKIALEGVATVDEPANPYVIAYQDQDPLFTTASAKGATASATFDKLDFVQGTSPGQPLFFEIWNHSFGLDTLIGGFVVYPDGESTEYTTPILWDWKERSGIARNGVARLTLDFRNRAE